MIISFCTEKIELHVVIYHKYAFSTHKRYSTFKFLSELKIKWKIFFNHLLSILSRLKLNSSEISVWQGTSDTAYVIYIVANRALSSLVHKTNKIEISPRKIKKRWISQGEWWGWYLYRLYRARKDEKSKVNRS